MSHQFINEIKQSIESSLPASSAIVAKVINIIYSPKTNAKDIADVIEQDPPLTAKILKVANSAYYGTNGKVDELRRAIVVLGFDTVRDLVTTISVIDSFDTVEDIAGIDRLGLWYHSVGTAKACQFIAKKTNVQRPDVAYIVGLLHDIGKILLSISFPQEYSDVVEFAAKRNTRIIHAERKLLNIDHTMIGKILCDTWVIPEDISTAILYHHDPMEVPRGSQKLAQITELGDYMCRKAKIGNPGDSFTHKPSLATMALLGRDNDHINARFMEIFKELINSKAEIEQIFSMQNPRESMLTG